MLTSVKSNRVKVIWHHLEFMSTISLDFGVCTKNWPRIDLRLLEFNFEFYFWRFRGGGDFLQFQQRVNIIGLYIKLKTCSRLRKEIIENNHFH